MRLDLSAYILEWRDIFCCVSNEKLHLQTSAYNDDTRIILRMVHSVYDMGGTSAWTWWLWIHIPCERKKKNIKSTYSIVKAIVSYSAAKKLPLQSFMYVSTVRHEFVWSNHVSWNRFLQIPQLSTTHLPWNHLAWQEDNFHTFFQKVTFLFWSLHV